MEKPRTDNSLSAEQKLEIRDEVERRLLRLPSETLKLIQAEVADRVAETEQGYARLAKWIGALGALLFIGVLGFTWNDWRERTKEIIRRTDQVETVHSIVLARFAEITNVYAVAFEKHRELTNRIKELAGIDNIVTARQLQKAFERVDTLTFQAEEALFTTTVSAASAGDALAYDRLQSWSTNVADRFSLRATSAIGNIRGSLTGPFYKPYERDVQTTWDVSLGFENARSVYISSLPEARVSVIETIWNAANFSKSDRMNFLVEVAQMDSTLAARRFAVELLNLEVKTNFVAWRPEQIREWWQIHRRSYLVPGR